jgi:hypothetical protein
LAGCFPPVFADASAEPQVGRLQKSQQALEGNSFGRSNAIAACHNFVGCYVF